MCVGVCMGGERKREIERAGEGGTVSAESWECEGNGEADRCRVLGSSQHPPAARPPSTLSAQLRPVHMICEVSTHTRRQSTHDRALFFRGVPREPPRGSRSCRLSFASLSGTERVCLRGRRGPYVGCEVTCGSPGNLTFEGMANECGGSVHALGLVFEGNEPRVAIVGSNTKNFRATLRTPRC